LREVLFILVISSICQSVLGQSILENLDFRSDFRFRLEQDWNSRKSDGTFRDNRSRLRYRLRSGVTYKNRWYETGFRLRTGNPIKQQDPQLTLGDNFNEFSTLPIGLEKVYFQGKVKNSTFWLGKNTFPFKKNNELYWSDNVYPEGIFVSKGISFNSDFIDSLDFRAGHFIISASKQSFAEDAYFQGVQIYMELIKDRLQIFPSLYVFKNIPNIPDGYTSFLQNYKILHLGSVLNILKNKKLLFEFEYSYNFEDYGLEESIPSIFKDQKKGFVVGLKYNTLSVKKDWSMKLTYAYLERYATLDYLAQNDWARWDYSEFDSPDGRLTNFKGIEFVVAYKLESNIILTMKYYKVNQLVTSNIEKENGDRIRFDIDVKF